MNTQLKRSLTSGLSLPALLLATGLASAQTMSFSIEFNGVTIGTPDTCTGTAITEGDILVPANALQIPLYGPLPGPCISLSAGFGPPGCGLGLATHTGCLGHPAGTQCPVEVDALSYGLDFPVPPAALPSGTYAFSIDECAVGVFGNPRPPAIFTENPAGDGAADVFCDGGLPPGPLPPVAPVPVPGSFGGIDGNGLPSASGWVYKGTGLVEPNLPFALDGDNLDAVDLDTFSGPGSFPVYFSVDGTNPNPCNGTVGSGTGPLLGFSAADVLVTPVACAAPVVYAPSFLLGLDLVAVGRDDLDALALWENGVPGLQSAFPYDWTLAVPTDMLLFSVRHGSAVIGMPDSFLGIPIQESDILMPPIPGGFSPFPAIFIAGEWLGLATTRTSPVAFSDELDALDTRQCPETGKPYCFGDGSGTPCPCGNFGIPGNGCDHSFGLGGGNLDATGKPFVSADTVTLDATNLPPATVCLFFQSMAQAPFGAPFGDGLLCTAGPIIRLGAKFTVAGSASYGFLTGNSVSAAGAIPPAGGTRHYQTWYRNAAPFCTPAGHNLTNAYSIVWVP